MASCQCRYLTSDPFVRAAFTNSFLMDPRWLIGGQSKSAKARASHTWNSILEFDNLTQQLFLERVLSLHALATRRGAGAKSATLRLTPQELGDEADVIALATFVLQALHALKTADGERAVGDDEMEKIQDRMLEGNLVHLDSWNTTAVKSVRYAYHSVSMRLHPLAEGLS